MAIRHLIALLAVLLAALPIAGADDAAADRSALVFTGRSEIESVRSLGEEDFGVWLEVANPGKAAVLIESANLLCVHAGGWLTPLDPNPMDGTFFRGRYEVAPTGENERELVGSWKHRVYTPASHCLLSLTAADGIADVVVPVVHKERDRPAEYMPPGPLGIGVIGPLHAVPFSDGKVSVILVGQHQVLRGPDPTDVRTSVLLSTPKGSSDPLTWEGLEAEGDVIALWPFVRRIDVATDFDTGQLRIDARAKLDGKSVNVQQTWLVGRLEPTTVLSPVLGAWQLSNGPGQQDAHAHYMRPDHIYAYDMVVVENGRTHRGDPHKNASHFAWDRAIRAVADGVVVDVCDREPDNPGFRGSTSDCRNNRVVIMHDDGLFTAYVHMRQRSAPQNVVIGKRVKAGQVIGKVGNSGKSSEPHLHFQAFRLDNTGRLQAMPVTFANATLDEAGKQKLKGVPVGGAVYHFQR